MIKRLILGALLLGSAACSTAPKDAPQSVYAIESGLAAAENVAAAYAGLPACGGADAICSDAATVARIKAAALAANTAVLAAQAAATDPTTSKAAQAAAVASATTALASLTALTSKVTTR